MLKPEYVRLPRDYEIFAGGDTGTYMGGVIVALSPRLHLYILDEIANYRYTGDGSIELTGITVGQWMKKFSERMYFWTKKRKYAVIVDANTTFKTEIAYGMRFQMNKKSLDVRTAITQEYVRSGRLHYMPWLQITPFEMENCTYPEKESAGTGVLKRIKYKDHCWDGVEHICSVRPNPRTVEREQIPLKGPERMAHLLGMSVEIENLADPHLGRL